MAAHKTLSKVAKLTVLFLLKFSGAFYIARRRYRRHVRILCYHGAWAADDRFGGDSMFIKPETFRQRLRALQAHKFNVVSLDDAVNGLAGRTKLPPDPVVITIDDGWYSSFAYMLPALRRLQMHATLYCDTGNLLSEQPVLHVMARYMNNIYGAEHSANQEFSALLARAANPDEPAEVKWPALVELGRILGIDLQPYLDTRAFSYMSPTELAEAQQHGFAIELHTHHHSLHEFEADKIEQEIEMNRAALAEVLERPPESFAHFCYPSGITSPSVQKTFERLGIRSATTLVSALAVPGDNPLFLPRLVDGDHLTTIEFEAGLSGITSLLRGLRDAVGQSLRMIRLSPLPDPPRSTAY